VDHLDEVGSLVDSLTGLGLEPVLVGGMAMVGINPPFLPVRELQASMVNTDNDADVDDHDTNIECEVGAIPW